MHKGFCNVHSLTSFGTKARAGQDFTSTCGQNYKFEGKERDIETGNDNFGARFYRSALGRWQSPDWSAVPAAVPYANLTNPATLNLYAMVSDNPETFADLNGHLGGILEPIADFGGFGPDIVTGANYEIIGEGFVELASAPPDPTPQQSTALPQSPAQVQQQAMLSLDKVKDYIASQAKGYGVPISIGEAVAQTESHFNINDVNKGSGDYGLMQVNKSLFGRIERDENGFAFKIDGARVVSDWKYNVHVGMAILRDAYQFAALNRPTDVARATYARYNAPKHWKEYAVPGKRVFRNVQNFMRNYDEYSH